MFTFLFDEYRKNIKREYKIRLAVIYLSIAGVLFFMGTILSIPTFIILKSRLDLATLEKESSTGVTQDDTKAIQKEALAIKAKISVIEEDNADIPLVHTIEKILSKTENDILITSISLKKKTEKGSITIAGIAKTRDALVAFTKRLKSEPSFGDPTLPLGSLTKSKDVPFSLSIDSKI